MDGFWSHTATARAEVNPTASDGKGDSWFCWHSEGDIPFGGLIKVRAHYASALNHHYQRWQYPCRQLEVHELS